jgi:ferredoxin-nitrite reductase
VSTVGADFTPEQKRWLEGFASGAAAVRTTVPAPAAAPAAAEPSGPDADFLRAQDRAVTAGDKLADQEKWKRAEHPLDAYARLKADAEAGKAPKPDDNFRWRYHGLFYVAPAQASYMCRLRIPNGILTSWQFAGVADIAERFGGGYAHVTTRANLQIREILPENGAAVVEGLADLGLATRGAGADNIRNVTGSATAGIDPGELIDTRPQARAWHHHILNQRALYGLPRKFNVGFDGGGAVPTLEDTNDIGFQAVRVLPGAPVEAGVWYRLALGGITGHKDFARDTGVVLRPGEAVRVADAVVRVFLDRGDRTNRAKARLKYVLEAMGFDAFLAAVEAKLGQPLTRVDAAHVELRPAQGRASHIGIHPQLQAGLNWIGVALPVGRLTAAEIHAVAAIARTYGDGDIRLTVWQNLLISGVADADIAAATVAIEAAGLDWRADAVRAGLVACTGNTGCKFANADTKGHALGIARHLDGLPIDRPVNIHLTGCPNSCAQHYIGDIGLVGVKVAVGEEDQVEGYAIHVGGGFGSERAIARLIYPDIPAEDAPRRIEGLLRAYLGHRIDAGESFHAFVARHEIEALKALAEEARA